MRLGVGLVIVVVTVVLTHVLRPGPSGATGVVDGPVVAVSSTGAAYPTALVQGDLNLRGDCLMLGNVVVFWPVGTSWTPRASQWCSRGDFDGRRRRLHFVGGGGSAPADDFLGGLGAPNVLELVAATGAAPDACLSLSLRSEQGRHARARLAPSWVSVSSKPTER